MLPSGTITEKYEQDKAIIRTRLQWGLFAGLFILLFALPFFMPLGWLGALNLACIYLIAVLGLQIITGYCGQINIAQSAFMGVGGLLGATAATRLNLPFEAAIIIGGLAATVYGVIFALPAIRVKGFYLAVTTLAAQFIFEFIFVHIPPEFFGGLHGGLHVGEIRLLTGTTISSHTELYYLIMGITVLFTFFAVSITRSKLGRAFMAIRDNDIAAQVMGINISFYKFVAFAISSFFAGVSGVLLAYYMRWTNVEQFSLFLSVWMLGMLIVGGLGSILGAIIGTITLRILQEFASTLGTKLAMVVPSLGAAVWFPLMNLLIGLVIIIVLIYEPRGLAHRWRLFQRFYRLWPFPY